MHLIWAARKAMVFEFSGENRGKVLSHGLGSEWTLALLLSFIIPVPVVESDPNLNTVPELHTPICSVHTVCHMAFPISNADPHCLLY